MFYDDSTYLTNWFDAHMDVDQQKKYYELLEQLYLCKFSPEEFAEAMDQLINRTDNG